MEFSRQEYWSGLPFPSPGDLPDPGIEPRSPALQADTLPSEPNQSSIVWSLLALGLMLLLPSASPPLHLTPWPWHIKYQPTWETWLPQMWHVLSALCGSVFYPLASHVLQLPSQMKFYPCLKAQLECQLFQEVFYQPKLTTFPSCSPCALLTALFLYLFVIILLLYLY